MDSLPPETIEKIVSYLDDKNRRILRAINSQWFSVVKYSNFTFYLTTKSDLRQIAKRLVTYLWPIEIAFKKTNQLTQRAFMKYLPRITNLVGLKLPTDANCISVVDSLTTLTNLQSLDADIYMNSIGKFSNLTSIRIAREELNENFSNLKIYTNLESISLSFEVGLNQPDLFEYFSNPTRITALYLKNNGLKNTKNISRFVNLKSLGHQTGQKLPLNFPELEELYAISPELLEGLETCSNLTSLDLDSETHIDTGDFSQYSTCISSLSMLKKLRIANKHDSCLDKSMKILLAMPHLEEFTYQPKHGREYVYDDAFSYIISKNLTKLKCLVNNNRTSTANCIRHIGKLTTLLELNMTLEYEPGALSSPVDYEPIMNLTNLTKLEVMGRGMRSHVLPKNIFGLNKLRILSVHAPDVRANLSALPNLEMIDLGVVNRETFVSISTLTLLTSLQIFVKTKEIEFSPLKDMTLLRNLNIKPSTGLSAWSQLSTLTDLRQLWLAELDTEESTAQLAYLQKLTYLHCTNKTARTLVVPTQLTSLQVFSLESEHVPQEMVSKMVKKLPHMRRWCVTTVEQQSLNPND
jgi:hypothetical protein